MPNAGESPSDAPTAIPLLETKLHLPEWREGLVPRPRLIEELNRGAAGKLTLISAPPGSGKTTLLAEWLRTGAPEGRAAAWVSLDPSDNEPELFWTYLIGGLRKLDSSVGAEALSLLHPPRSAPMEAVLTVLINELVGMDPEPILILDDYHAIEASAIHSAMGFFLDRLPPRMHLILTSRVDPPLPLARLRARGEVMELRAGELRFTREETANFLNEVMALGVSDSEVAKLEDRTEGWIAGLKLAALSMQGRTDIPAFIESFSGDHRHIADYLADEALLAQSEVVRHFLLGTGILDRMSGPLCDAVLGTGGSQALLEELERTNLFVVPLDHGRGWYRYHHLFADLLRTLALRKDPEAVRTFHRRASAWYEGHGLTSEAVHHALEGGDPERAARLLELAPPGMDRRHQSRQWLDQVKRLPEALVQTRPALGMSYAWALLNGGELDPAEARLLEVEGWLNASEPMAESTQPEEARGVVLDEERRRTLPMEVATARVYLAQTRGDIAGTVEHARRSLALIPEEKVGERAKGTALLGLAEWAHGELESGYQTFSRALSLMELAGDPLSAIRGIFVLGDIRVAQGRLGEAERIYGGGLRRATEHPLPEIPETDELHLGLSEVLRERGDLDGAMRHLRTISESDGRGEHTGNAAGWCAAMARIHRACGDLEGAMALLERAESLDVPSPLPRVRPLAAEKVRIRLAQGRMDEGWRWVRDRGLSPDDGISYMREFEHLTLVRMLLTQHGDGRDHPSHTEAMTTLHRLAGAAEVGGRTGSLIEIRILQAVGYQAQGELRSALATLDDALTLGEPEEYLRTFVDEGDGVRDLLRQGVARGIGGEYARMLLAAFDAPPTPLSPPADEAPAGAGILTPREFEVLRLVAAGARNQEVAAHLAITPATVKRHLANLYLKLKVGHRTAAVARARELKLL